jgi:4-hydroxyproline epimerase
VEKMAWQKLPVSKMKIIDSHTEGEPTRVVISGGPDLGSGTVSEKLKLLSENHDHFRQSVILEPRGSDVLVGALLCKPTNPNCASGVIFFNNSGYLGMCGHGAIGVAITLKHLGLVVEKQITLETPVGEVLITFTGKNQASVKNVSSYIYQSNVTVNVKGLGKIQGDVAWGGNWFFLVNESPFPLKLENAEDLIKAAESIKKSLIKHNITGNDGAKIDHIEFFSAPFDKGSDSRNFVLCPGGAYDRSPCGTGTSAKIACLASKDKLQPGESWVQESVIGSKFEASYEINESNEIIPTITGRAFIIGESNLIFNPSDPFRNGITPQ